MAQYLPSAEYTALVSCTDKLVKGIAIDPQIVATKLYTRKLITRTSDSGQQEERASELVRQVTSQVMNFPKKFEEFLAVLKEIPALQDLAELLVKERFEKIKMEDKATEVCNKEHITETTMQEIFLVVRTRFTLV